MTHPAIHAYRRHQLEQWIERAIALLDALDGSPDLEDGADIERDDAEHDSPGLISGGCELQYRWDETGGWGGRSSGQTNEH